MSKKVNKVIGLILVALGVGSFVFASVIAGQVKEGEKKIHRTQKGVNSVKGLSKINEYAEEVGKIVTDPVQQKINQGKKDVKFYSELALWLRLGGIFSFACGAILFIIGLAQGKPNKK